MGNELYTFIKAISLITLYITAFSFGVLTFSFIDRLFPDPLQYGGFYARGLSTALAAILIAFPLHLFLMRLLGKVEKREPEHRQSKVAKWLTYITLVALAAIIIGDLIAVLANLLGGELTSRFFLKALTVLVIAGSIFGYYLWSLQKEGRPKPLKVFTGVVTIVIALAVGYGLFLVGTPAQQRLLQFDERRVSDLQQISWAVDAYWEQNKRLPEHFDDLRDRRYYVQSFVDPKTEVPYEYRAADEENYELCAVFETDSLQDGIMSPRPFSEQIWEHGIGRACFEFEAHSSVTGPTFLPVK